MSVIKRKYTLFTVDNEDRKCIFTEVWAREVRKTKAYKELKLHLDKPHIKRIGFCQSSLTLDELSQKLGIKMVRL